jgi:hypothetical protein
MRRHGVVPPETEDVILHDFDREGRVLRLLFVSPGGKLLPVTYRLCPTCGVTMEEQHLPDSIRFRCTLCLLQITAQA